ncbi:hypothetical protein Q8F55_001293 [Vanrija albida]|uniref:Uncharacterized protein n=1 Tax=Vanrija albida TaxID=181172 RepID=A0ABR3QFN6_9TREE
MATNTTRTAPSTSTSGSATPNTLRVYTTRDRVPQGETVPLIFSGESPPFRIHVLDSAYAEMAEIYWGLDAPGAQQYKVQWAPQTIYFRISDAHSARATSPALHIVDGSGGSGKGTRAAAIAGGVCGGLVLIAVLYLGYLRWKKREAQRNLAEGHRRAAADLRTALALQAGRPDVERGAGEAAEEAAPPYDGAGLPPTYKAESEESIRGVGEAGDPPALPTETVYPPRPR